MLMLNERERLLSAPRHRSFERNQTAHAERTCRGNADNDTERASKMRNEASIGAVIASRMFDSPAVEQHRRNTQEN